MSKKVSWSHLAIPVRDIEASIKFYKKYAEMHVVKRRTNPVNVWMGDGIRPFHLALLESDPCDIPGDDASPEDQKNKVAHPIVKSAHIGFTCRSNDKVKEISDMAKEEGILEAEAAQTGWPGGYCTYITDPSGHSVEFSYNQEAGYNAVFEPVCDLDDVLNTYEDGEEHWEHP